MSSTTDRAETGAETMAGLYSNSPKIFLLNGPPRPKEEWRPIPSYPEYEASSFGNIRSTTRRDARGYLRVSKVLTLTLDGKYLKVGVGRPQKNKARMYVSERVHRLVCEAFHGSAPKGKPYALHKNDVKTDNTPLNLYWGTQSENLKDAYRNGLLDVKAGRNPAARLSLADIRYIRSKYIPRDKDYGARALAKKFNSCHSHICRILRGESWNV